MSQLSGKNAKITPEMTAAQGLDMRYKLLVLTKQHHHVAANNITAVHHTCIRSSVSNFA